MDLTPVDPGYRLVAAFTRSLVRAFFRRVEVVGLDHVPRDRGGVLVSWHPNGVVDPGIILASFPAQITFGARDGLFRVPGFGLLLKAAGAVPIVRPQDSAGSDAERRAANEQALERLALEVVSGRFSCLFPEGDSHDHPFLLHIKSGAARFFYQAWALSDAGGPPPAIVPVGLHYDAKYAFRSDVLIEFHPPIELPPALARRPTPDDPPAVVQQRVRALTAQIEGALQEVVHATESWEVHHQMHRVRKLVRAERARRAGARLKKPRMREQQLGFARVWDAVRRLRSDDPVRLDALQARVSAYDDALRAVHLEDHELDRAPPVIRPRLAMLVATQAAAVFLLLPPMLLLGIAVHLPAAVVLWSLSQVAAKRTKDIASIQVVLGAVLVPLTWLVVGLAAAWAHAAVHAMWPAIPDNALLAAVLIVCVCIVGAAAGLHYLRLARETARAVRVLGTRNRRRATIAWLLVERAELLDVFDEITQRYDLPGEVGLDGQVVLEGQLSDADRLRT